MAAQAAYSYGTAVLERFDEIMGGLQSDDRVIKILESEGDQNLTLPLTQVLRTILPEYFPGNRDENVVETRHTIWGWQYRVCSGDWRGRYKSEELAIAAAQTWMRG